MDSFEQSRRAAERQDGDDPNYPSPGESWAEHWDSVRWPLAEKVEFWDGAPVWQGGLYGTADVRAIERAFPGWTGVLLGERTITMRPADPEVPWPPVQEP